MVFVDYFVCSFQVYRAPRTWQATITVLWVIENFKRDVEQLRFPEEGDHYGEGSGLAYLVCRKEDEGG